MAERRVLSGTELQASDIEEFEKALSRVPGVGGIVPPPPTVVPAPQSAAPAAPAAPVDPGPPRR
jgi:hypothetical protein